MDKKKKYPVEGIKNVLIVVLTLSALWLAWESRLMAPDKEELPPGQDSTSVLLPLGGQTELLHPVRMVANGVGGGGRYGTLYDRSETDALFGQVAGMLMEAMTEAGPPEKVSRSQWERALTEAPGVFMDFQGLLPMEVLSGWLYGGNFPGGDQVRRLLLTVEQTGPALYFKQEDTGVYYRCAARLANPDHMTDVLAGLTDNGCFYAFETEWAGQLDPDTLFQTGVTALPTYVAANPIPGEQLVLEGLMAALDFSVTGSSFYASGDELVARNGRDMLRLSHRGTVHYETDDREAPHFPILSLGEAGDRFAAAETCRRILDAVVKPYLGEGSLYLSELDTAGGETEVVFRYSLNGVPVYDPRGAAARFLVGERGVTSFDLNVRSYTLDEAAGIVLPPRQAAAAVDALDLEGRELLLAYGDQGGERVAAGWIAAGMERG